MKIKKKTLTKKITKECEAFCEKNSLDNVHFLGRRPQKEMPSLIAEADVMLITLKNQSNYNLTLPGRTQAYMACGKPVICCANGEVARVVEESESGFVVQAENVFELAFRILQCSQMSRDELWRIGNNGLVYSQKHYNRQLVLENIERVLSETKYGK